ncbi:MAG: peptide deformylase [Hyphomicrobiales bacterium]|nr:MAG: peptide deformylase [Hyphomicrobiales bacterium]
MAILDIVKIPDEVLRKVARPVDQVDKKLRSFLDDMLETMYDAPGVGLAAPQVGVLLRVVTIDCAGEDEDPTPLCFVNPQIVSVSEEVSVYSEGCLSIPEFYADVERPVSCVVKYQDRHGVARELQCKGLLATCIQHEIDHLDGVLFIDYISRLKRERIMKKFIKLAKLSDAS